MAYEDERMSIFFRISRLETIVGDFQKEHDLGKCTNQPLKELVELRERNKDLKHKIECMDESSGIQQETICRLKSLLPEPCTRFKNSTKKEWAEKINEEVGEVIEAMYDPEKSTHDLLREMVDVVTVMKSFAYAIGVDDNRWGAMQKWVNENNRRRGYMDEPVR